MRKAAVGVVIQFPLSIGMYRLMQRFGTLAPAPHVLHVNTVTPRKCPLPEVPVRMHRRVCVCMRAGACFTPPTRVRHAWPASVPSRRLWSVPGLSALSGGVLLLEPPLAARARPVQALPQAGDTCSAVRALEPQLADNENTYGRYPPPLMPVFTSGVALGIPFHSWMCGCFAYNKNLSL